jgi:hypothetical protein
VSPLLEPVSALVAGVQTAASAQSQSGLIVVQKQNVGGVDLGPGVVAERG